MYDFGEGETAEICVVLLQGNLTENVSINIFTYSGTAEGWSFFYVPMSS